MSSPLTPKQSRLMSDQMISNTIVLIIVFVVAIFGFVALAYYLGGRQILKCNLVEALQSDYMM